MTQPFTPEFLAAMEAFDALVEAGEEDTPVADALWCHLIDVAPDAFIEMVAEDLRAHGELPEHPCGYDEDGQPLYALADLAACLGRSEAEVLADLIALHPLDRRHLH